MDGPPTVSHFQKTVYKYPLFLINFLSGVCRYPQRLIYPQDPRYSNDSLSDFRVIVLVWDEL